MNNVAIKSSLRINNSVEGETIEMKIRRITDNKEPIKDGSPLVYTERKDGVLPAYDIRTDRFEIAIDAMDKVSKSRLAQREARMTNNDGEAKSSESVSSGEGQQQSA